MPSSALLILPLNCFINLSCRPALSEASPSSICGQSWSVQWHSSTERLKCGAAARNFRTPPTPLTSMPVQPSSNSCAALHATDWRASKVNQLVRLHLFNHLPALQLLHHSARATGGATNPRGMEGGRSKRTARRTFPSVTMAFPAEAVWVTIRSMAATCPQRRHALRPDLQPRT
jgi:hypothetical protein